MEMLKKRKHLTEYNYEFSTKSNGFTSKNQQSTVIRRLVSRVKRTTITITVRALNALIKRYRASNPVKSGVTGDL